jgi:hypothetical protein
MYPNLEMANTFQNPDPVDKAKVGLPPPALELSFDFAGNA